MVATDWLLRASRAAPPSAAFTDTRRRCRRHAHITRTRMPLSLTCRALNEDGWTILWFSAKKIREKSKETTSAAQERKPRAFDTAVASAVVARWRGGRCYCELARRAFCCPFAPRLRLARARGTRVASTVRKGSSSAGRTANVSPARGAKCRPFMHSEAFAPHGARRK